MDDRNAVSVRTIDGTVETFFCIDWFANESGVLTVRRADDMFTTYAKGKWISASDIYPDQV